MVQLYKEPTANTAEQAIALAITFDREDYEYWKHANIEAMEYQLEAMKENGELDCLEAYSISAQNVLSYIKNEL